MWEFDPGRLSEFDPIFTATAVLRGVPSFKVSRNHRDKLHGGGGWKLTGTNLGILSPRVNSANETHCPLIQSSCRVEPSGMFH